MSANKLSKKNLGDVEIYEQDEDDSHLPERLRITPDERYAIVVQLGKGIAIGKIRDALKISVDRFWSMLRANPKFTNKIQFLRQSVLEELSDQLLDASLSVADVHRARVYTDNLRWLLAKRIPQIYGDKIHVEHNIVDINAALSDAIKRVSDVRKVVELQNVASQESEANQSSEESEESEQMKKLLE